MLTFLAITLICYLILCAYSYWSYHNVFPVNAVLSEHLSHSQSFGPVPFDTYAVRLLVRLPEHERSKRQQLFEAAQQQNLEAPLAINVRIIGTSGREALVFEGDTRDFALGDIGNFSDEIRFDEYKHLGAPGALEFRAHPFEQYQFEISVSGVNGECTKPEKVVLAGQRGDAYYPMASLIGLPLLGGIWLIVAIGYLWLR